MCSIQSHHKVFIKDAISGQILNEILSEFREHAPKYPNSLRISENYFKICKILGNFREISGIDQEIQSRRRIRSFL